MSPVQENDLQTTPFEVATFLLLQMMSNILKCMQKLYSDFLKAFRLTKFSFEVSGVNKMPTIYFCNLLLIRYEREYDSEMFTAVNMLSKESESFG